MPPSPTPRMWFTTAHVARSLNVSIRTVYRWLESGALKATNVCAGSKYRAYRIHRQTLSEFMAARGMSEKEIEITLKF